MAYRLDGKYTEPELVVWVERQRAYSQWWGMWLGGIAVGLIIGWTLAVVL